MTAADGVFAALALLGVIGGLLYLVDWTMKVIRTAIDSARGLTKRAEAKAARVRLQAATRVVRVPVVEDRSAVAEQPESD